MGEKFISFIVKDLNWSQQTSIKLRAIFNSQNVVVVIDTGSSGVVVSESCF